MRKGKNEFQQKEWHLSVGGGEMMEWGENEENWSEGEGVEPCEGV